ncbi:Leucine dehydrogenase [Paraconexibacter sp. AEG42_29]|uniref:Leucine dehydrogenase n=1 Tax=Paraconexibacter sp. AEG42_29 TaxID=2997339 RepID=A0AAU7AS76_9ACTN
MDPYAAALEHEQLLIRRGTRSGLFTMVAVHSTARGPSLGGCRMWRYDDARSAMRDALRLSRAMTYKSAVAGLPLGGGKGVIMLRPDTVLTPRVRRAALEDFADTVAALDGAYIAAEDVGTSARDMDTIAGRTEHVAGRAARHGGSGDPSPFTAIGVEAAVLASVESVFGSASLKGRSVAVVGLGHVGLRVARLLARRGATLLANDIDPARRVDAAKLGARWVTAAEALGAPVDVYCPCALGGILDHDTAGVVQAPVIAGAANNQLAADDVAELLRGRSILWAPDFVANAGGIINIAHELRPGGYAKAAATADVRRVGDTLRAIYAEAAAREQTPLAAALALGERRLAEAPA